MKPNQIYELALTADPVDFSPVYVCPVCKLRYASQGLAQACSLTSEPAIFRVGEIVKVDIGYGWFDGLEHWMALNQGYEFQGKPTHATFFVVTSIDYGNRDQSPYHLHRAIYSLKTLGIKNGHETGLCGWNPQSSHYRMTAVKNPDPRMIEESKPFLGEVYGRLL